MVFFGGKTRVSGGDFGGAFDVGDFGGAFVVGGFVVGAFVVGDFDRRVGAGGTASAFGIVTAPPVKPVALGIGALVGSWKM